jgi:hypothetical protein
MLPGREWLGSEHEPGRSRLDPWTVRTSRNLKYRG